MTVTHTHEHTHKTTDKTLVAYVLDETGSMLEVKDATIDSFNEYIASLKKDKKNKYLFTLTQFNSQKMQTTPVVSLHQVEKLSDDNYRPDFVTPLVDAVYETIENVDKEMNKMSALPKRTLVVIQTDGLENASRKHTTDQLEKLIKDKKENHDWDFIFLGADQDAWVQASQFGIRRDWTVSYFKNDSAIRSTSQTLGDVTINYAGSGAAGAQASLDKNVGKDRDSRKKEKKVTS